MARASTSSIEPAPSLNRRLRRWLAQELRTLRPAIVESAAACQADRYRKHFDTLTHSCLLLFHGLSGSTSLRQSYAAFGECSALAALCGWRDTATVSYPQCAASNSSRPPEFLSGLVPALVQRVRQIHPRADLPCDLHILDGTRLVLPQSLAPWQTCHNGVGIQILYHPALDLPEQVVVLQDEKTSDYQGMDKTIWDDRTALPQLCGQTPVL
jgi:hypothetical protein